MIGHADLRPTILQLIDFTPPKPIPTPSEPETQVFTSSFVPPTSFFRDQLPIYGPPDLTPAQCHEVCTLYCDGTTTKRDLPWSKRLLASHPSITPYALHYLGLILANNSPTHDLGVSMLATAHELDYTPSTPWLLLHISSPSTQLLFPISPAIRS
ncbi:hypothetical protein NKR19_g4407, partial [Coniochaeta hoffmannii]